MTAIDPSVACILLAAGSARRFGGGKLFAQLGGQPLWEWAAERLEQAGFESRYLVVDPAIEAHPTRSGWDRVENPFADEGIASSIRAGVQAASDQSRIVIALADMPFIDSAHFTALAHSDGVIFTRYPDGRPGCPAAFPASAFISLLDLRGDRGAAALCSTLGGVFVMPPDSQLETFDIDKTADLSEAERILRHNFRPVFD